MVARSRHLKQAPPPRASWPARTAACAD